MTGVYASTDGSRGGVERVPTPPPHTHTHTLHGAAFHVCDAQFHVHAFSRAWCHLRIFESTSDWLIVLLALSVSTDCFSFGFTALNLKPLRRIIFITKEFFAVFFSGSHSESPRH